MAGERTLTVAESSSFATIEDAIEDVRNGKLVVVVDAADRESCVVWPSRTNTPLQALNLMNDVAFVEASRKFAERIMAEGGKTADERLRFAFAAATSRPPWPEELRILRDGFDAHLSRFRQDPDAARKLLSVGDSPRDERPDVADLAAYAATASLILNLDETITKR